MQSASPSGTGDRRPMLDAARRRHPYATPLEVAVASMIAIGEWVGLTAGGRRPGAARRTRPRALFAMQDREHVEILHRYHRVLSADRATHHLEHVETCSRRHGLAAI